MKKMFIPLAGLLLSGVSYAQQVKINWGEESKTELAFGSFVNGATSEMIKLCFEEHKKAFSKKTVTPVLARYNDKLAELNVRSFEVDDKNISFNNLLSVKGKLFLFTSQYDNDSKTTTFNSQEVNLTTLDVTGRSQNLGSFDAINKSSQSSVGYELSKDSSKVLMFGLSPASKKEMEKYYIGVYDNNMAKLWENTVTLPYKDKFITVLDRLVTNDGKVGVIIKHYDQEVSRETIIKDGEKVPSYITKLLLYDQTKAAPAEFILNVGNKFVHTVQMTDDDQNTLQLFGLYKDKYNGYISGYFLANIDKNTRQVVAKNVTAFPEDLVSLVKVDKQGSDKEKDPGLANTFRLAHVEERADGSKDYVLENTVEIYHPSYTTYSQGVAHTTPSYWEYDYGDIINIAIKRNNTNIITRIPKLQVSTNIKIYSSFKALPYNDKLVLFYNDNDDNIDKDITKRPSIHARFGKGVLMMAVIDDKGNMTRSTVFTHKDVPLTPAIRECNVLDKNRIGLYAQKIGGVFSSGKDMIGILELK